MKCIVFDFDGTLMDTGPGIIAAAKYALAKHNIEDDEAKMGFFVGPPLLDSFMQHYGMSEEEAVQAVKDYREYYRPIGIWNSRIYEGIPQLLDALTEHGFLCAVATSKPIDLCRQLLEHEGILSHFTVTCGTAGAEKDNLTKAELIAKAIRECGCNADEAVMVGDTKFDIFGAKKCRVASVGAAYGYGSREDLETAGADYIAESVNLLQDLLLSFKE